MLNDRFVSHFLVTVCGLFYEMGMFYFEWGSQKICVFLQLLGLHPGTHQLSSMNAGHSGPLV